METKITSSTVRIMLSHSYCNFEISSTLENPNGITTIEIENCRQTCQALAMGAVNDYKRSPTQNPKEELKKIENEIAKIKAIVSEKNESNEITDPAKIAEIEKLPMHPKAKKANETK